jgi:hypothetical protein
MLKPWPVVSDVGTPELPDDCRTVVVVVVLLLLPLVTAQAISPPATTPTKTGIHLFVNFILIPFRS